jgi:signal transduction histidine kinase/ligand-binding sensor domain-containing protein
LRSSNTCRSRLAALLAAALLACGGLDTLFALDPDRAVSQYVRDEWTTQNGFPGGTVSSFAQTTDGYLWIGTEKGLVRFDGVAFRLTQHPGRTSAGDAAVLGLVADREGGLWALLHGPTLVHYRKGDVDALPDIALPNALVTAMCLGADGNLLLSAIRRGVMTHRGGQFVVLAPPSVMPASFVIAMAQTRNGDLWLGTRDVGLFRVRHGQIAPVTEGVPDRKINALMPGDGDDLWIGSDNGVVRWDGTAMTPTGVPPALAHGQALTMARDRDANVWVAAASAGLVRIGATGVPGTEPRQRRPSGGDVTALFEDREGNLWIGSTRGLERLRAGAFLTYGSAEGMPAEGGGAIDIDGEQRLWLAPPSGGLYTLRDNRIERVAIPSVGNDVVYAIANHRPAPGASSGSGSGTGSSSSSSSSSRSGGAGARASAAPRGDLWIGRQHGGLTRLRTSGGTVTAQTYTQADGLAQNSVYAVLQSRDGAVWAGTLSGGVSRFGEGRFTTYTSANGLAANTITALLETADATMWFGTPNGLTSLSHGTWKTYHTDDGLPSDAINCLVEERAHGMWIGTAVGVAFFDGSRLRTPPQMPAALQDEIFGIETDGQGSLWIATASRVLRVRADKLLLGTLDEGDLREYGSAEGLPGTEGVKRQRSVTRDARGRIWFSTGRGLSVVDPVRATVSSAPALVQVQGITVDGVPIGLRQPVVRIPPGRQRITFSFVGLSLSVPERVRYRYRLDGFDRAWSEPVAAREAVYTNLSPGGYQFRVIASNSDGLWSGAETTLPFDIDPAYWQTRWFQLVAVLMVFGTAAALYRFRMQQLAHQLDLRFEERLAERTRIAQELHDTLLQGFVSASMQLHVAAEHVPAESPAKPTLNRVIDLMARVIEEGRNAVRGLRTPGTTSDDLEQAFQRAQQELAVSTTSEFRVIVEGRPRPLHPIVRDEVYRLGREALMNAIRHAEAKHIEVELEYAAHHLRMLVRDDGRGIDAEVLQSGRQGHWGLSGMRERAEQMGARLRLWSRDQAGTEVELFIPGPIAFVSTPSSRGPAAAGWRARLASWRSRRIG